MSPLQQVGYWSVLLIPFVIGVLSGGQTMYAKQGADFFGLLSNVWGCVYWISRGLIPVGAYLVWYHVQGKGTQSPWIAVICGLGSEAIIRSKFYVTSKTADGKTDDVLKGLFDLIEWWQALCLTKAAISRAGEKGSFVEEQFGKVTDFPAFAQRMKLKAAVFPADVATEIGKKIDAQVVAFQADATKPNVNQAELHELYGAKLGYVLLESVGKSGIRTLGR